MSGHDWRRCYPDERNELIKRMRALLEKTAWYEDRGYGEFCVACQRDYPNHEVTCELAALLKEAE